ncbi:unnamed protein product [Oikopleura dioica]|uniref:Glucosidase II subunit alpha n=1 Tax=Oikopleura dioica TaxID=34765 RepID=E4XAZ7_OIKDI|nr:unnamed protein product [Oikopleura dioica]
MRLKTSVESYVTEFSHNDEVITVANSRNLLFVEELRAKNDDENWEEKFKTHKDSRPRGPESVSMDVVFTNSRNLYGLPEHTDSFVLANTEEGEPYRLFNLDVFQFEIDERMALYGGIPFVASHSPDRSSAALWLNAAETWVDIKYVDPEASIASWFTSGKVPEAHTFWLSETGKIDLFLFPGPSIQKVNDQYTVLTGRPQLPPQWATAYHQCKWNYRDRVDEPDVAEVNANFDVHDIPADVIWLDIEHTDGKRYFTWDPVKFPSPEKMIENVASKGRKMVTIIDPHIKVDNNYYIYSGAKEADIYVKKPGGAEFNGWCWPGNSAYIDFTDPRAREWWAEQFLFENYKHSSASLYTWNDMNEPSVFNGPEVSMHRDMIHHNGWEHRAVHQMYGLGVQRATYEGQLKRDPNSRPFVLSRAFFVGTQRWGPIWTGDNGAEWSHLKSSVPMLLALGVSGMPFVGADVGGFFGNPEPELLWRWYQLGAFQPFFRAHAHLDSKRREPWVFEEPWTGRMRNAIRYRYRLLPLWNELFYESHKTGIPAMRPIWYNYPKETESYGVEEEYMLGDTLLVAPVMDEGKRDLEVYFPGGDKFFRLDYHEAPAYSGNTVISAGEDEQIPVFIKAGRVFASKERIRRSSTLMENDPITINIALDGERKAQGKLYFDDQITHDYEKGEFSYKDVSFDGKSLSYSDAEQSGVFESKYSFVEQIVIYGFGSSAPKSVKISANGSNWELESQVKGTTLFIRKPNTKSTGSFTLTIE